MILSVVYLPSANLQWWACGGQFKDHKIGICCFSAKPVARAQIGWLCIRIMCPSGATCLPMGCTFCDLTLLMNKLRI